METQNKIKKTLTHPEAIESIRNKLDSNTNIKRTELADSSFQTLMKYSGRPDGNLLIGKFGYALKAEKIKEVIELHQEMKNIDSLTKRPGFIYYSGVL